MDDCKLNRWQILKSQLNNLTPNEFANAIDSNAAAILIDCRTPEEYAHSRIANAINFNYLSHNLAAELDHFDPCHTYFVYCRSERRSIRICTLMKNGGFQHVYNLDGGLTKWIELFGENSMDRTPLHEQQH